MRIGVKILGYKTPQRYAVRRAVIAAHKELCVKIPDLYLDLVEVRQRTEIENYTPVLIYPSLMVNDKLVCIGRFPRKDEIVYWLRQAVG